MRKSKLFIALLRVAVGWLFLYKGVVAIKDSSWSLLNPEFHLKDAQTFAAFYSFITSQPFLGYATYAAKGILVIAGVLLILGVGNRIAAFLGILLMAFLYFPLLHFPHVGTEYYIVDDHLIYIMILLYLFTSGSKESLGLGSLFRSSRY